LAQSHQAKADAQTPQPYYPVPNPHSLNRNKFEHYNGLLHNCRGMKTLTRILLAILATVTLAGSTALAQSVSGSATITDLMGERPGNSYYQNTSSGAETQGSGSSTGSAGANVLQ
jgi:hypothetical protein